MMRFIDEFTPHELEMLELKGMTASHSTAWDEAREHENDLRQESLQADADERAQAQ